MYDAYDAYDVKSREFNRFDMKQEGEKNKSFIVYFILFFLLSPSICMWMNFLNTYNRKIQCAPKTCLLDETNKPLYIWKYVNKYKYWE